MGTPFHGRGARARHSAFPDITEICAAATPADIFVSWAAVLAAIGGLIFFSGLG